MWQPLVRALLDKNRREALGLVGGAIVALAGGAWVVIEYFDLFGQAAGGASPQIEANCSIVTDGSLTAGGDVVVSAENCRPE